MKIELDIRVHKKLGSFGDPLTVIVVSRTSHFRLVTSWDEEGEESSDESILDLQVQLSLKGAMSLYDWTPVRNRSKKRSSLYGN